MQGPVVGSSSTEKMLPHKRCQSFGQGGLLWLPSIGGIWDLFTCSTGAIEIPKTREKVSHALAIRPWKLCVGFNGRIARACDTFSRVLGISIAPVEHVKRSHIPPMDGNHSNPPRRKD